MSRVELRSIEVRAKWGRRFDALKVEALGPIANVIFAENAAGKSTLASAATSVFNPAQSKELDRIFATITANGQELTADVVGKNQSRKALTTPHADLYLLDLVKLLQGLENEQDELQNQIDGGYNLQAIQIAVPKPKKQREQTSRSKNDYESARSQSDELDKRAEYLPQLKIKIASANDSISLLKTLKGKLLLLEIRDQISALENQLNEYLTQYPGSHLLGDRDIAHVEDLLAKVEQNRTAHERARKTLMLVAPVGEHSLATPRRAEGILSSATITQLESLSREIVKSETRLETLQSSLTMARSNVVTARDALSTMGATPEITADSLEKVSGLAAATDLARTDETYRKAFSEAASALSLLSDMEIDELRSAQRLLLEWLRLGSVPQQADDGKRRLLLLVALLFSGVAACILLLLGQHWFAFVGIVVTIFAGCLAIWHRPGASDQNRISEIESQLSSNSHRPSEYSHVAITEQMVKVNERLASANVDARNHEIWTRQANLASSNSTQAVCEQLTSELNSRFGLNITDPYRLEITVQSILTFQKSVRELKAIQAQVDSESLLRKNAKQELRIRLAEQGYETQNEPEQSVELLKSWYDATEQFDSTLHNLDDAVSRLTGELQRLETTPDVPEVARIAELRRREEPAKQYRLLLGQLPGLRAVELERKSNFIDSSNLTDAFFSVDQVRDAIAELGNPEQEKELLTEELHKLEHELQTAERATNIQAKLDALHQDLNALSIQSQIAVRAEIGSTILELVKRQTKTEASPEVISTANRILSRITAGRYELDISDSSSSFGPVSIIDRTSGQHQSFQQLSTGTKIHMVLAVRLALIELHETHVKEDADDLVSSENDVFRFPLLVDEAMATSGPQATIAIADVLKEASNERQVIVFTNQKDDVAILSQAFGTDLSVHFLNPEDDKVELPLNHFAVPPDTPSRTTAIDIHKAIDQHSPHILVSEQECVASTLALTLRELPLERQEEIGPIIGALDEVRKRVALANPQVFWHQISNEPWCLSVFRPEIFELCTSYGNTPKKLMDEVCNLKNFRKRDEVRAWFAERGFLDPTPLSRYELVQLANEHLVKHPNSAYLAEWCVDKILGASSNRNLL